MQTPPFNDTTQPVPATNKTSRLVIDAPMRMFHWLFALSFVGAYVTADSERWRLVHVTLGYTMAGLLMFRLVYGLLGPKPFGLGVLWRKISSAPAWIRSIVTTGSFDNINWRQGQNLLMALLVVAMLCLVIPLTLSGYAIYNELGSGLWEDALKEVHELFGNALLLVVLLHIALIAGLSIVRKNNIAQPMLTGRIPGKGPDLVPGNRVWLATVLLLAVVAFGVWQWQQSPQGLALSASSVLQGGDGGGDTDD